MAELFLTVRAGEARIRFLGKALGVYSDGKLPYDEKQKRNAEQTPRIKIRNENERGKHHGEIPIVDPTASAAFVFHKPSLEGAEEKNADHIADGVRKADEQKNALVDDMRIVENADDRVERKPRRRNVDRGSRDALGRLGVLRGNEILFELLLTSHAFRVGGEESQKHFQNEYDPDDAENDGQSFDLSEDLA